MQVYFIIRCKGCHWWRKTNGTSDELRDLRELRPCANCHGPRKFRCPKCGSDAKMMRVEVPDKETHDDIPKAGDEKAQQGGG